jgi:hypothetical protein
MIGLERAAMLYAIFVELSKPAKNGQEIFLSPHEILGIKTFSIIYNSLHIDRRLRKYLRQVTANLDAMDEERF